MSRDANGLTPKQARFRNLILKDPFLRPAVAYQQAGYVVKNDNVAAVEAHRLLNNPIIAATLAKARRASEERTGIIQDRVARELARIAFGDQRAVMKWGPDGVTLLDSEGLTDDAAALVAEASQTITEAGGTIRLKTHSKIEALALLGKHLGMFKEQVEHTGPGGGPLEYIEVVRVPKRERSK